MHSFTTRRNHVVLFGTLLALVASCLSAPLVSAETSSKHSGPNVRVVLTGSVKRGDSYLTVDKAGAVKPGEIVRWSLDARNEGTSDAHDYGVSARVPEGTEIVPGSASGESAPQITYSIDGGKTFAAQPTTQRKQADGMVATTPAPTTSYTNVRFTWTTTITAGNARSAHYDVRVK